MKSLCLGFAAVLLIASCGYETPVQRVSESRSQFSKPTVVMSHNYPEKDVYRIFQQGATGFVPMSSIRADLEAQAEAFCERQGKTMVILGHQRSSVIPIPGNFPKMELVFAAIDKPARR